jgi:hypothetical protein
MCGADISDRESEITLKIGRARAFDFDSWACVAIFVRRQIEADDE